MVMTKIDYSKTLENTALKNIDFNEIIELSKKYGEIKKIQGLVGKNDAEEISEDWEKINKGKGISRKKVSIMNDKDFGDIATNGSRENYYFDGIEITFTDNQYIKIEQEYDAYTKNLKEMDINRYKSVIVYSVSGLEGIDDKFFMFKYRMDNNRGVSEVVDIDYSNLNDSIKELNSAGCSPYLSNVKVVGKINNKSNLVKDWDNLLDSFSSLESYKKRIDENNKKLKSEWKKREKSLFSRDKFWFLSKERSRAKKFEDENKKISERQRINKVGIPVDKFSLNY